MQDQHVQGKDFGCGCKPSGDLWPRKPEGITIANIAYEFCSKINCYRPLEMASRHRSGTVLISARSRRMDFSWDHPDVGG
jgi:hypothetical protein